MHVNTVFMSTQIPFALVVRLELCDIALAVVR